MSVPTHGVFGRLARLPVFAPVLAVALIAASVAGIEAVQPQTSKPAVTAPARALSQAFRDAAKAVEPAVVMIKSEPAAQVKFNGRAPNDDQPSFGNGPGNEFGLQIPDMPQLHNFFKNFPQQPQHSQGSLGSGMIIDPSGLVLTNNHVVSEGGNITVRLHDGREFKATHIVTDPMTDLALLRIQGADHLTAVKLGDSDKVEVGDWVLALGHPFGLEGSVTAGIISAKGRGIGLNKRENFIQTDAAINPGNSGGPLVNIDGEVIGINTAISSQSGGNEGIGFAIPINLAKWVVKELEHGGVVHRARMGVMVQPLSDALAKQFGLHAHEGVLVADVAADSPAAKAGIKAGDVIVDVAGKAVTTPRALQSVVEESAIGHPLAMTIVRNGKRTAFKVNPTEMGGSTVAADSTEAGGESSGSRFEKLGMEVQNLTPDLAKQLKTTVEQGVVVANVQDGGAAEQAGLSAGDVIVAVAHHPVKSVDELAKALGDKSLSHGVLLLVKTSEGSRFVVLHG